MKKRLFSVLLALCMVLTALPLTGLTAFAATSGDFEYEVLSEIDKTCEITGYSGGALEITIPSTLDGYTVIGVGSNAFLYCVTLESITIPDSVTSIGDGAFFSCYSLESITIPDSVKGIGMLAFNECYSLTSITIPDSVTNIGSGAFYDCDSLASVTVGNSVASIGGSAFSNCDSLTNITVESGNPNYSSENGVLFDKDKTKLIQYPEGKTDTAYTIPASVTHIGDYAFAYCTALISVTLPNSVTRIGDSAFYQCTSLTSNTIPSSVTSIGDFAFAYCDSLARVTIPDSVTSIGEYAFASCDSLASITIGNGVASIGEYAFAWNDLITSVTIPDSVKSIGSNAFSGCDLLTIRGYSGSYAETYAVENEIPFVALTVAMDANTGITITEDAEGNLPENTQLAVKQVEALENSITYDITLTQNGAAVQPAGMVTVKIPVPETMDGNACKVYREESNGLYTDMHAVHRDGYMVFTTDHFSQYVLTTAVLSTTLGDVNGDGTVDAVDARWVLQAAAGMRTLENDTADVNADGKIDAVDARWILQAAAGMRTL